MWEGAEAQCNGVLGSVSLMEQPGPARTPEQSPRSLMCCLVPAAAPGEELWILSKGVHPPLPLLLQPLALGLRSGLSLWQLSQSLGKACPGTGRCCVPSQARRGLHTPRGSLGLEGQQQLPLGSAEYGAQLAVSSLGEESSFRGRDGFEQRGWGNGGMAGGKWGC